MLLGWIAKSMMLYLVNCRISTCAAHQTAPSKVRPVDIEQRIFNLLKVPLLLNVMPAIKLMLCPSPGERSSHGMRSHGMRFAACAWGQFTCLTCEYSHAPPFLFCVSALAKHSMQCIYWLDLRVNMLQMLSWMTMDSPDCLVSVLQTSQQTT